MAIYYVRNRAMTEAEYEANLLLWWCVRVFFGVAGGLGFALYRLTEDLEWPKVIRYMCMVVLPVAAACWAVRYTVLIRSLIYVAKALGLVVGFLALLWHVL